MKASVGICTVPKLRIFFLPAPRRNHPPGAPRAIELLGRSEFALRQGFAWGKTLVRRKAPPRAAGPRKAEENADYSSSSLRTAMKASVGICTVPKLRIFFLPSFCFSSSFFFRVMSPP